MIKAFIDPPNVGYPKIYSLKIDLNNVATDLLSVQIFEKHLSV